MQIWMRYAVMVFGALFSFGHLIWILYSLRFARSRDDRLEFMGIIIPGIAGLLMAGAAWMSPSIGAIVLCALALVLIVFGRAAYELIVFRYHDQS